MSVQDALDVWGYVEPYLSKLAEQDSDQFESCEELLTKLAEVIPPPPEELLVKIGPDKLLNAGDRADALTEPPQWMCPEFPARLEFLEGLKFRYTPVISDRHGNMQILDSAGDFLLSLLRRCVLGESL